MKRILVVVAHPDDEILGMGGYIAKLTNEGNEVNILIVTDGSTSQYRNSSNLHEIIAAKKEQTQRALSILGVKKILYGDLPDMKLDVTEHIKINEVIEKAIDEIRPDAIFTHFYGDVNLDHQRVYQSVLVVTRPVQGQCVKELYVFEVPSSTEWNACLQHTAFIPNVFIDISAVAEKKYAAFEEYKDEIREFPHPRSVEYLRKNDIFSGLQCGLGATERFMLLRKLN